MRPITRLYTKSLENNSIGANSVYEHYTNSYYIQYSNTDEKTGDNKDSYLANVTLHEEEDDCHNDHDNESFLSDFDMHFPSPNTPSDISNILIREDSVKKTLKSPCHATEVFCYSECSLGRIFDKPMIKCTMCMKQFHNRCTDATTSQTVWTCNSCHCLSETVVTQGQHISELHLTVSDLVSKQNEFYNKICNISTENEKLTLENKQLKKQLYEYRLKSFNYLSSDNSSSSSGSDSETDSSSSSPVVVKKQAMKKRKRGQQTTSTESQKLKLTTNRLKTPVKVTTGSRKKPNR